MTMNQSLSNSTFKGTSLSKHATFEHFLESENNAVTCKLLKSLIEESSTSKETANPIFLSGISGSGKTHILMAIANKLKKIGKKTHYITATHFSNHIVNSIRENNLDTLKQKYQELDFLIVDDVQDFANKKTTQEELISIFDAIYANEKNVIFASNSSPQTLQAINSRLINRFEWGVHLTLESLLPEEREQLILKRANFYNFNLPKDVFDFLLNTFRKNVKTLTQAIETLAMKSHLNNINEINGPISLNMVEKYLSKLIDKEHKSAINPIKITQLVAKSYGINTEDILSKTRVRPYVLPRQIAMFLCRTKLNMSFKSIGDFYNRDHSTVITNVKFIQKILSSKTQNAHNQRIVNIVNSITAKLTELCD